MIRDIFMNAMAVFILLLVIFYPTFVINIEAFRGLHTGEDIPLSVRVSGIIPIYRTLKLRSIFYSYVPMWLTFTYVAAIPVIIIRALALTVLVQYQGFIIFSVVLNMVYMLVFYIIMLYVYIDIAKMVGKGVGTYVLLFLLQPVGIYTIARSIVPYMRNSKDEMENTFLDE